MGEWFESAKRDKDKGMSLRAIGRKYNVPYTTVHDRFEKEKNSPEVVGVIGDLHLPFGHPNYLAFLKDTFKKYHVTQVVSVGDIFDHYSYSRFTKKPIAMTAKQEREMSIEQAKPYYQAFPNLKVCLGNHDVRYIERVEEFGIDDAIIKDFKDIYEMPKGWEIYDEYDNYIIINDVLYIHGSAYNGQSGAKSAAINEQMSVCMGHGHSFAGVSPIANKRKLMFGMNVGCGIDPGAYAFAYNKKDKLRPLLGCGIIYSPSFAIWVPMGAEFFRN
jgi:predicted phosphodiesterase